MLQKQLNRRKWRVKEPLDDVLEDESPQLIQDIFDLLVNRNVLSKDYITNEICFDLEELTEICGLRDDFFKESLDITLLKKIDNISYIGNRK